MEPELELKHGTLYVFLKSVTTILKVIVIGLLIFFTILVVKENIETENTNAEDSANLYLEEFNREANL